MAYKRSRATFEADLQLQQSPYVTYGTPLPPLDPDTRDDGSYVPVWKQEVTDEQGRKRLHGAFTGGFSAGYFNTVGSKEGWTPSQFVSSRANRKKDAPVIQQKPEDFMDEEDVADAEESRKLQMSDSFAGLGSTPEDRLQNEPIMDVLKTTGDTMGVKLLRKMGWRDGQGVGPKVRRKARLDEDDPGGGGGQETHLFAPENSPMVAFVRKNDRRGLGFEGEGRLADMRNDVKDSNSSAGLLRLETEKDLTIGTKNTKVKKKKAEPRGGFGVGILNDNGSDDEDPYHMGPQISYNRIIGGDKKKRKPEIGKTVANPLLSTKPVFVSKKASASKAGSSLRRCHDGRLPLDGFVCSQGEDSLSLSLSAITYEPPEIPSDWKSSKRSVNTTTPLIPYQSSAEVAKLSTLDPKSRASILGETALPGKSVFDYLSPSARSRIVSATNNPNLPPALDEAHSALPAPSPHSLIPPLSPTTAHAALKRGTAGWTPYADDPQKLSRYRIFLEVRASLVPPETLPPRAPGASSDDWVKEMQEFAHAAQIFRPVSGLMATRFTSSSATPKVGSDATGNDAEPQLLTQPAEKVQDPAMQAAAVGMYGPLTRSVVDFFPSRLLCKRFNVRPPAHVAADPTPAAASSGYNTGAPAAAQESQAPTHSTALPQRRLELVGKRDVDEMVRERGMGMKEGREQEGVGKTNENGGRSGGHENGEAVTVVDPDRNEALERERPGDAVFHAVFGSDSEDD
ncbi:hypothetical protein MMC07_007329 [Pseudocyphellaria aurata]|nr:hypothetical protein [Pseudocyphellaria aurata]